MKNICLLVILVLNIAFVKAQDFTTSSIFNTIPIKIVAHTDSSIFLLGKKEVSKGKYDLFISKHSVGTKSLKFDTCLNFIKLFNGKFQPENFKAKYFQADNSIVVLFDLFIGEKKTLIGKRVDFNGKVSESFIIDQIDMSDKNMKDCRYELMQTIKGDILITIRRSYKSGYERDKCILIKEGFSKIWEYDFPKINSWTEVNLLCYVSQSNQLIYFVANSMKDITNTEWMIRINKEDSIVKYDVEGLKYDLKVRNDSIKYTIVNPLNKEEKELKIYWPFINFPMVTILSSSQILFYNLVNIDDEKHIMPSKKAVYYKRVDIKNNTTLFDKLIPLTKQIQENLTYLDDSPTNIPTSKDFVLYSEKIANGKVLSLFRHFVFEDSELLLSSYDISNNKFNWINFMPRKLNSNAPQLDVLVFSHENNNTNISFYENKENFNMSTNQYTNKKYLSAKNYDQSNFISHNISDDGIMKKEIVNENSIDFLFPWLAHNSWDKRNSFFECLRFLPIDFLFKNN